MCTNTLTASLTVTSNHFYSGHPAWL
uniref:Uncharacterized protein n=1 Tax=Anguilla anguilla TaxID=7936 RepID=A0A0E9S3V5_ANGAN